MMVWREIKFKRFFRVIFLVPMMTTPVIMTVIWRTFFHESLGPVNDLLGGLGVKPILWLSDPVIAKFTVIIVEVWQWTPFMFLLLLAGLLSLPIGSDKSPASNNKNINGVHCQTSTIITVNFAITGSLNHKIGFTPNPPNKSFTGPSDS